MNEPKLKLSDVLDSPEKWTQGAVTRDEFGLPTYGTSDPRSCKFCLYGAILFVSKQYGSSAREVEYKIEKEIKKNIIRYIDYNDKHTTKFEDIKNLIDKCKPYCQYI